MKKIRIPNTYVIIFFVIALCAVATWFVPGGQYVSGPDGSLVFRRVDSVPQTWQIFSALYHGFVKQAGIIIFILVEGGAFWILNSTGAVNASLGGFISGLGGRDKIVLASIALVFSAAGAIFGMSEEAIPFVGIVVPLVISMGYDAIMGMLIVYVASNIGFSSAFMNMFTEGIAQQMSDLPLFSGMGYRIFCWMLLTSLLIGFILIYASRTKKTPVAIREKLELAPAGKRQKLTMLVLVLTIAAMIVGVTCFKWYLPEITALFLAMGIIVGVISGYGPNKIVSELLEGAKDIMSAAIVVGLGCGIVVILKDGKILDTVLYGMQRGLSDSGELVSLSAMYGIQAAINFVIPSATAKAAVTIPVMAPFSDMVGVSRQAMVLAFQFGDGFTNMITPTSGVLMGSLAMAKIPYSKWAGWVWKLVLGFVIVGFLLLIPTVLAHIPGF